MVVVVISIVVVSVAVMVVIAAVVPMVIVPIVIVVAVVVPVVVVPVPVVVPMTVSVMTVPAVIIVPPAVVAIVMPLVTSVLSIVVIIVPVSMSFAISVVMVAVAVVATSPVVTIVVVTVAFSGSVVPSGVVVATAVPGAVSIRASIGPSVGPAIGPASRVAGMRRIGLGIDRRERGDATLEPISGVDVDLHIRTGAVDADEVFDIALQVDDLPGEGLAVASQPQFMAAGRDATDLHLATDELGIFEHLFAIQVDAERAPITGSVRLAAVEDEIGEAGSDIVLGFPVGVIVDRRVDRHFDGLTEWSGDAGLHAFAAEFAGLAIFVSTADSVLCLVEPTRTVIFVGCLARLRLRHRPRRAPGRCDEH